MQGEALALSFPFADDPALDRIIAGFDPRDVANDGRFDDDLFKSRGILIALNACEVVIEPLDDLARHEMVLR